jgi:hypothetical protein
MPMFNPKLLNLYEVLHEGQRFGADLLPTDEPFLSRRDLRK